MMDSSGARDRMVERQIAARGLTDPRLLDAFRAVPRELFVPSWLRGRAYDDCALPIEADQTISQPFIVALTIAAAEIKASDHVLEVGAGSGYAAAVLGHVAANIVSIERHRELTELARRRMEQLRLPNVRVVYGDGMEGCPESAPFDAILCAAAGSQVPQAWREQLRPGGRIVMPRGQAEGAQALVRLTLRPDGCWEERELGPVRFVPLVGGAA